MLASEESAVLTQESVRELVGDGLEVEVEEVEEEAEDSLEEVEAEAGAEAEV